MNHASNSGEEPIWQQESSKSDFEGFPDSVDDFSTQSEGYGVLEEGGLQGIGGALGVVRRVDREVDVSSVGTSDLDDEAFRWHRRGNKRVWRWNPQSYRHLVRHCSISYIYYAILLGRSDYGWSTQFFHKCGSNDIPPLWPTVAYHWRLDIPNILFPLYWWHFHLLLPNQSVIQRELLKLEVLIIWSRIHEIEIGRM